MVENGGDVFLQNTGNHPHNYMVWQPRPTAIHIYSILSISKRSEYLPKYKKK